MSPSLLEPDCLQVQTGPASGKRSLETIKKKKKKKDRMPGENGTQPRGDCGHSGGPELTSGCLRFDMASWVGLLDVIRPVDSKQIHM